MSAAGPADVDALDGLVVTDLSGGVAGQFCGKLLATYGASVVLVEPPAGTPTRNLAPMLPTGPAAQRSLLFRHLNQDKDSVVIDDGTSAGRALLAGLLDRTDVVIRDRGAPAPPMPSTVVDCEIAEFPADGPYGRWQGTEMIHQALSGYMNATGHRDRHPIYGLGRRAYYTCGVTAYVSVLAALHKRTRSGFGQRVSTSVFESAAAVGQNFVSQYSYNGTYETRGRYAGLMATLRCRDGWVVLFPSRDWAAMSRVFGAEESVEDPRLGRRASGMRDGEVVTHAFRDLALAMTADDLVERAQRARISAEKVVSVEELVGSHEWRERGRLHTLTDRRTGRSERGLGPPFRMADDHRSPHRPSPELGSFQHVEPDTRVGRQRMHELGRDGAGPPGHGPLADLRVIDFTTAWAGPMATRILAYLGAHVIRVDAPRHLDSWRGGLRGGAEHHYPGLDPGKRPYDRNLLFNTQGTDKWSLGLDLKAKGGPGVLTELARVSDVVVTNFTHGVLDRLGAGFDALSEVNPQIVVVEMPAFSASGPMAHHQGMGNTMEAASGMADLMGYGEGAPVLTGPAYLDPVGGLNAAAAVLTALQRRARTGDGCRIEVAQIDAAAHWIGEHLLEQAETGSTWRPRGNRVPDAAPHDAYPAAGADEWVAIAVCDDAQWHALCTVIGADELADAPRFAAPSDRWRHQGELDEIIGAWTCTRDKHEAAALLQEHGVPAAPVSHGGDIADDPGLRAAGFLIALEHPEAGRHYYPGLAFGLDRTPGGVRRAAPCFGQHNDAVLRDVLGLDEDQVSELRQTGAVCDVPAADAATARRNRAVVAGAGASQ